MRNCGLINVLRKMNEGIVPHNHAHGSVQVDRSLITARLAEHVLDVGLLDRSVLQSDHSGLFLELRIEGIFGQYPDKLAPHKFLNIKQDDPKISEKNTKILHKQFEYHNIYR
jgi:hypothetical protein